MTRTLRVAALAFTTLAATALPVLAAAPAHASARLCGEYLHNHQVRINQAIADACHRGARGGLEACMVGLVKEKVHPRLSLPACSLAGLNDRPTEQAPNGQPGGQSPTRG